MALQDSLEAKTLARPAQGEQTEHTKHLYSDDSGRRPDDGEKKPQVYENNINSTAATATTPTANPDHKQNGHRANSNSSSSSLFPYPHRPGFQDSQAGHHYGQQPSLMQWCGFWLDFPEAGWTIDDTEMAGVMSDTLSAKISRVLGIRGGPDAEEGGNGPDTNNTLRMRNNPRLEFTLLGEGSWNRTYTIALHGTKARDMDSDGGLGDDGAQRLLSRYLLRVSLPVWPGRKVTSEVANMRWVRQNTSIPLPEVLYFEDPHPASSNNTKGLDGGDGPLFPYPWILMEKAPGVPFAEAHRNIPQDAKLALARDLADWVHELAAHPFPLIGSLDLAHHTSNRPSSVGSNPDKDKTGDGGGGGVKHNKQAPAPLDIGPVVGQKFFGDWRLEYCLYRGPFSDLHTFAKSLIACQLAEVQDPRQQLRTAISSAKRGRGGEPSPADRDVTFTAALAGSYSLPWSHSPGDNYCCSPRAVDYCSATEHKPGAPVCLCTSRYLSLEHMDEYKSRCEALGRLVDVVVPRSPIWPASPRPQTVMQAAGAGGGEGGGGGANGAVLHHWDISEDNLLVDPETGRPTALLDWEQLFLVPIPFADYYPCLLAPGPDAPESPTIREWEPGKEKPEWRLRDEDLWNRRLMRDAFDGRLLQLDSPWLDACVQEDFFGDRVGGRRQPQSDDGGRSSSRDATSGSDTWDALATDVVRHAMTTWYELSDVERLVDWPPEQEDGSVEGGDLLRLFKQNKLVDPVEARFQYLADRHSVDTGTVILASRDVHTMLYSPEIAREITKLAAGSGITLPENWREMDAVVENLMDDFTGRGVAWCRIPISE
ncbi:hypothetical protein F5883DRAFT_700683 [Diaporthe sp. PMI_573]|nr:hypothetical protein F5883DRAFT_700683 [Diaporthaceae sp. PMI_573]